MGTRGGGSALAAAEPIPFSFLTRSVMVNCCFGQNVVTDLKHHVRFRAELGMELRASCRSPQDLFLLNNFFFLVQLVAFELFEPGSCYSAEAGLETLDSEVLRVQSPE